jgi:hypothetical protein
VASKKALRARKSRNVIGGLIKSGMAQVDVSRLSDQSLAAGLQAQTKNTPMAKALSSEMAKSSRTPRKNSFGSTKYKFR